MKRASAICRIACLVAPVAVAGCTRSQGAPSSDVAVSVAPSQHPAGAPDGAPGEAKRSLSTETTTPDGEMTLRGLDGSASHTHGGDPAHLSDCRFEVVNRGVRSRIVNADAIEFLGPPREAGSLKPRGLLVEGGAQTESAPSITIAAGVTATVILDFAPAVDAYESWNERFAFRVRFRVDGVPLSVVAETHVKRRQPSNP